MNLIGITYMFSGYNGEGVYAGATARPDERPQEHIGALNNNRHYNNLFQESVNEHGMDSFKYVVRETVDFSQLAQAEARLVQEIKNAGEVLFNIREKITVPHPVGYSLSDETRKRQSEAQRRTPFSFVSPSGELRTPSILSDLCREFGLDLGAMSNVHAGKRRSHKGWTRFGATKPNAC